MRSGDAITHERSGRLGWVDEFLSDGDAFVTYEDGTHETVRWGEIRPQTGQDRTRAVFAGRTLECAALTMTLIDVKGWIAAVRLMLREHGLEQFERAIFADPAPGNVDRVLRGISDWAEVPGEDAVNSYELVDGPAGLADKGRQALDGMLRSGEMRMIRRRHGVEAFIGPPADCLAKMLDLQPGPQPEPDTSEQRA